MTVAPVIGIIGGARRQNSTNARTLLVGPA
jgi:hypothetical protein